MKQAPPRSRSIEFYERMGCVRPDRSRTQYEPIKVSPLSQYGGGKTRGAALSLGDNPRQSTKIELIQYVGPPASARPLKPSHQVGVHRIAMRVNDLDGTVAEFRKNGIVIREDPREKRTIGGRQRYVLFPDPDENMLELIELFRA